MTDSLKSGDVKALAAGEQKIAGFDSSVKNDEPISSEDLKGLTSLLNDTNQVFYPCTSAAPPLNKALTTKLSGTDFSAQDAHELCAQMERVYQIKTCLGQNIGCTAEQRTSLISEYNRLNAILHN
jgi:carboxypeptidase C (cathepsin A)